MLRLFTITVTLSRLITKHMSLSLVGSLLPVLMIPSTSLYMYMPVQYYAWLSINMISVEIFMFFCCLKPVPGKAARTPKNKKKYINVNL
jgi:hypothetical protein